MSGQASWEQIIFIVGAFVMFGGIVISVMLWLWGQISSLRRSHDQFRVDVAKDYVSMTSQSAMERRIETALGQLRTDFDRGFDRVIDMMGKTIPSAVTAAVNASAHAFRKDSE